MVYVPQEDSYLLVEQVKKYAKGKVLDMGTGSGIQAFEAGTLKKVKSVLGVDVDPEVIKYCNKKRKELSAKKVKFQKSNLFSAVKGTFDMIIFNPPYLPQDTGIQDIALYGGKKGYELTGKFLDQVNNHLESKGVLLLLFSSQTNKKKIEEFIEKNLLQFEQIAKHHQFFEDLYVYKITKTDVLKLLERKGVHSLSYLDKGKRGVVFVGKYKGKKVAVKIRRKGSEAMNRMENEAKWLQKLKKGIGPRLCFSGKNYLCYQFVEGEFILDYMKKSSKRNCIELVKKCLDKCYALDQLQVDKLEMHHPVKHIIVGKEVRFIDFERMHHTLNPKNVTQFVQFICGKIALVMKEKKVKVKIKDLRDLAQDYKREMTKKNFTKIKKEIEQW